jgi:hypothetical protein
MEASYADPLQLVGFCAERTGAMTKSATLNLPGSPVHLGEPIRIYRQELGSRIVFAVRLLVWLVLVVGVASLHFDVFRDIGLRELRQDFWRHSSVLVGALVVALVLISMLTIPVVRNLRDYLLHWHDVAVEYAKGIAYYHRGEWRTLRWEEIVRVTRQKESASSEDQYISGSVLDLVIPVILFVLGGYTRRYVVWASGRTRMCFSGTLSDVDGLMDKIEGRVRPRE